MLTYPEIAPMRYGFALLRWQFRDLRGTDDSGVVSWVNPSPSKVLGDRIDRGSLHSISRMRYTVGTRPWVRSLASMPVQFSAPITVIRRYQRHMLQSEPPHRYVLQTLHARLSISNDRTAFGTLNNQVAPGCRADLSGDSTVGTACLVADRNPNDQGNSTMIAHPGLLEQPVFVSRVFPVANALRITIMMIIVSFLDTAVPRAIMRVSSDIGTSDPLAVSRRSTGAYSSGAFANTECQYTYRLRVGWSRNRYDHRIPNRSRLVPRPDSDFTRNRRC